MSRSRSPRERVSAAAEMPIRRLTSGISGGSVCAQAVQGAGIGAGLFGDSEKINITGGAVVAGSSSGGAGIGGGVRGGIFTSGGSAKEINISDASVIAAASNLSKKSEFDRLIEHGGEAARAAADDLIRNFSDDISISDVFLLYKDFIFYFFNSSSFECFGTGIGAGARGHAGTIRITNSNVTAEGGVQSAGIGSSKENSFDAVQIVNSTVSAKGGENGAGIGSGCQSSGNGSVTISGSKVTADGGNYAAGIGTGKKSPKPACTININNRSDITAKGGMYGAGIGGGCEVGGGTVTIADSDVNAYGGNDAAGIGGGEDGNGGHIEICDHANVYAKGNHYGAGIGGGENGDGEYCAIEGTCTVEAQAGSSGTRIAIGYGDHRIFTSYTQGTVALGNAMLVKAGFLGSNTDVYAGSERFRALSIYDYVKLYPCRHSTTVWKYDTTSLHVRYCTECGVRLGDQTEEHNWNSENICTECGASAELVTVTLEEEGSSGSVITTQTTVPKHTEFTFPECANVPDGKEFICWSLKDRSDSRVPGDTAEIHDNTTYEAVCLTLQETPYIAPDGSQQTASARVLDGGYEGLALTDGWYVFKGEHESLSAFAVNGNVSMILEDGCMLKGSVEDSSLTLINSSGSASTLSLYGQSGQTGTIDAASNRVTVGNIRIYGGNIQSTDTFGGYHSTLIARGTLDIHSLRTPKYGTTIRGGNISTTASSYLSTELELGWTALSDSISLNGFNISLNGAIRVTDGKAFIDEDDMVYTGTLTSEQITAMEGKTLMPYPGLHHYGDPEWIWTHEHEEAAAVFTCTDGDCGNEQRVEADVTFAEDGDDVVYTAACTFNGQEYTVEKRVKALFAITVGNHGHGTVTADKTKAKPGEDVTLTVTPDSGYIIGTVTVTDAAGNKLYFNGSTFAMPDSDVTVEAAFTDTATAYEDGFGEKLAGYSISLRGNIGVNFYMELSADIARSETAYMRFTIPGNTVTEQTVYVRSAETRAINGKTYYIFPCSVAAKNMTSEIKARMADGARCGTEYSYSVKDYADYLLAHTDGNEKFAKAAPVVRAIISYGAYAKEYFDKTDTLGNLGSVAIDSKYADFTNTVPADLAVFDGATLSLKSETTLSLYFRSEKDLSFACDGMTVEKAQVDGCQVARIRGINSGKLLNSFTLTVSSNDSSATLTYSPMNYCYQVLNSETQNNRLMNVVKSLYLNAEAANEYFNS